MYMEKLVQRASITGIVCKLMFGIGSEPISPFVKRVDGVYYSAQMVNVDAFASRYYLYAS